MLAGIIAAMTLISQTSGAAGATCSHDYAGALSKTVTATLIAVKSNDAASFFGLLSHDGVTVGQESPALPYAVLALQFKSKTGRYCDLFSCAGKTASLHHLFAAGKTDTSIDLKHLLASVTIAANTQNELDLNYKFTAQCTWVLTGISYP